MLTLFNLFDITCAYFDMKAKHYHKYFVLGTEDKSWGLHVLDCGKNNLQAGSKSSASHHPFDYRFSWEKGRILQEYQLIYVITGKGWFESDQCTLTCIESGMIILLHPGIWHRYKRDDGHDWETNWIGFDGDLAKSVLSNLDISISHPLKKIGQHNAIISIFEDILEISRQEFSGYQQVLAGDVMKLFGWIHALGKRSEFKEENIDSLMYNARLMLMRPEEYP